MSTRGLVGIRKNNRDKSMYNHFDSYPSGLGETMVEYIKEHTDYSIEKLYDRLTAVDSDAEMDSLSIREKDAFNRFISANNLNQKTVKLNSILGDFEGSLELYHMYPEINLFIESNNFIRDSLFCEFAYIINLDTKKLEIFLGFQKEPDPNNRYGTELDGAYYPCKLVKEIPLNSIRKDNFNLKSRLKKLYF